MKVFPITIDDIAEKAINDTFKHYFTNLTSGEEKVNEALYIGRLFQKLQPWLLLTEVSLMELRKEVFGSPETTNLISNLTAIFIQRFYVTDEEKKVYVNRLAVSFSHVRVGHTDMAIIDDEYYQRCPDPKASVEIIHENLFLMMLMTALVYLDTSVITETMS